MFILDKNLSSGGLQVGVVSSYNRKCVSISSVSEGQNFSYDSDYYFVFRFDSSGSGTTWNVLSDGTLVEARNAGLRSYFDQMASAEGNYMSVSMVDPLQIGKTYTGTKPSMYTPATINGGSYNVAMLRLGTWTSTGNFTNWYNSDFYKYIFGTGKENWSFENYVACETGGSSGSYASWFYVDPSGNVNEGRSSVSSGDYSYTTDPSKYCTVRFVAFPTGTVPTITPEQYDFGNITSPKSYTFQISGTPTVTYSIDGSGETTIQTNTGNFTFDMSSIWDSVGIGSHEVVFRSSWNGYQCGAKLTFTKSSSVVSVTTKPHASSKRPLMCRIVDDVSASATANVVRSVTNNANDDAPIWEPMEGDTHVFANDQKTASEWAVAARVQVDNSEGTTNAEIRNAIALGVVYENEVSQ